MDAETLKLLGNGGSQMILAIGYLPVLWLVRTLWTERGAAQEKLATMLAQSYEASNTRKDLWTDLGKVVDGQSRQIEAQTREISDQKRVIADMVAELRASRRSP